MSKSLKAAYPAQNFLPDEYAVKLWYGMLKDIPYAVLTLAVQQYILKEHFPPAVADIRNLAASTMAEEIPDWSEGYNEMITAVHRYGYMNEAEALASMSEVTRETVRRLGWMNICCGSADNDVADRANFRQIYSQIATRRAEKMALPVTVRERLEAVKTAAAGISMKGE